ncbi:hypothetical protein U1Q18_002160 [Sarracenia purpurea var. burkii]
MAFLANALVGHGFSCKWSLANAYFGSATADMGGWYIAFAFAAGRYITFASTAAMFLVCLDLLGTDVVDR